MKALLQDTGERIIPPKEGEVSFVYERHKFTYFFATQYVENKQVLDVGCGTGYGCKILAEKAYFVYGIDYNFDALKYCREFFSAPNICYSQMDSNCLSFGKSSFDVEVTFQVIEHMSDVNAFLRELKRVVKPGGYIIISTPNRPKPLRSKSVNPFHENEMDFEDFQDLMETHFTIFQVFNVQYDSNNWFRTIVQGLPIYKLGIHLKRKSPVKKIANRMLNLSKFKVTEKNCESAMDFLAVCDNS